MKSVGWASGLRMPAEWEPHEATWLAWPHDTDTWPTQMEEVRAVWLDMIAAIADGEQVHVLANDRAMREDVAKRLAQRGLSRNVFLHEIPTDDVWIRDSGPIFVRSGGGVAATHWLFDCWGKKYEPGKHDSCLPERIAEATDCRRIQTGIVLEGGSIDVNGEGDCLTTRQCLLNPNRNAHLTQEEIEGFLDNYLGASHVIWLGEGIAGDDTDGHVDNIARFVSPDTIVAAVETDASDVNHAPLEANLGLLRAARDRRARPFTVVPLPMPGPLAALEGRLPASYANFYVANGAVLVPIFRCPRDHEALAVLKDLFAGRRVVGLPSEALVLGLGGVHCVTREQPA